MVSRWRVCSQQSENQPHPSPRPRGAGQSLPPDGLGGWHHAVPPAPRASVALGRSPSRVRCAGLCPPLTGPGQPGGPVQRVRKPRTHRAELRLATEARTVRTLCGRMARLPDSRCDDFSVQVIARHRVYLRHDEALAHRGFGSARHTIFATKNSPNRACHLASIAPRFS